MAAAAVVEEWETVVQVGLVEKGRVGLVEKGLVEAQGAQGAQEAFRVLPCWRSL